MARSLEEIANDLVAAEAVLKAGTDSMLRSALAAAGASLPAGVPDIATMPYVLRLPDGRGIQLSELAAELRDRS